jgi:hypothetical protein
MFISSSEGLYGKTNMDVREICLLHNSSHADEFPANNETVDADLYKVKDDRIQGAPHY